MRTLRLVTVLCSIASIAAGPADAPIMSRASTPIFIPATAMLTPDGELSPIVPDYWRARHLDAKKLSDILRARAVTDMAVPAGAGEPCGGVVLQESDVQSLVVRDSRETTIGNAKAIFIGTVERVTPGLFHGSPGSLLQVGQLARIKDDPAYRNVQNTLYMRHPHASFRVGTVEYCREVEQKPEVGDRVLVFAFDAPLDGPGLFIYSFANDFILEPSSGAVHTPPLLRVVNEENRGVAAVAADIRRFMAGRQAERR